MTRWQTFTFVCDHLRGGLLDGPRPRIPAGISWELLIEASSHHYVIPALAWCLQREPGLPCEVSDYLDVILAANTKRNTKLLKGLQRIVEALNGIDIAPVLLKGSARLIDGSYPTTALRFLGDLDVLIPAERSAQAAAALRAIGFCEQPDFVGPPNHHHLPMLCDMQAGIGVELHTELLPAPWSKLMPSDWFYRGTDPYLFGNLQVRLPNATRSVGHVVAHDQLGCRVQPRRNVELRQLLDLAIVRKKHEDAIDWMELDCRFGEMALGKVLATYLEFGEKLFGQAKPRLQHAARLGAMTELRWRIDPPKGVPWGQLSLRAIECVADGRRNLRDALKFLNPVRWPLLISRILSVLRRREPSW